MFDLVLKIKEKVFIATSPPHTTKKGHSTEITSKHWEYLLYPVKHSGKNYHIKHYSSIRQSK